MTGVGVQPPSPSTITSTPFPARTSRALRNAGSERAWVSIPRKSGPVAPARARPSQIACVTARTWASLKERERDDPRWPEVPNATRCKGSNGSGFPV
ncbi:MAG: hypothetical protein HW377_1282 [Actinobacteria bacterium]|nr:hypothetical protein [Actinomycetota bacterium]